MREAAGRFVPAENPRTVGSLVDLIAVTLERFAAEMETETQTTAAAPTAAQGG